VRERLLRTILIFSGDLQHERERPDMERKYMNSDKSQRKEPELTTSWSGISIQSKLAFSGINCNRRLGLSPCAGVATGLLKTPRKQFKKQAKMKQHWYLS